MNAAVASIPTLITDRTPPTTKAVRSFMMDVRSKSVSWPKLFVPKYRGDAATYARWWVTYIMWHMKVVATAFDIVMRRAIVALVPSWILFTIGYSTTIRNAKMQAIVNAIDAGAGGGLCLWYNGSRPATGGSATTLLGTLTFSTTSGTVSGGVLTFNAITSDSSADATSTVTWGRVTDDTSTFCFDFSISTSGADINVNTTSIVAGAQLSITSWTITDGNP